jgi:hypothetical protein
LEGILLSFIRLSAIVVCVRVYVYELKYRRVMANALGHFELEDWKKCVQPKPLEEQLGVKLREEFKPFQLPPV